MMSLSFSDRAIEMTTRGKYIVEQINLHKLYTLNGTSISVHFQLQCLLYHGKSWTLINKQQFVSLMPEYIYTAEVKWIIN